MQPPVAPPVLSIALIGYGSVGRTVGRLVREGSAGPVRVVGVLVRDLERHREEAVASGWPFVDRLDALLDLGPVMVVEMGGHASLRQHGAAVLASGADLMTVSVGALADDVFRTELEATALRHRARILVPAGAIAGLDGIGSAATGGLDRVAHVIRKPPAGLLPPDEATAVLASGRPRELFAGAARDAARQFPENANVVASVSLAGIGLDRTEVRVVADPGIVHNTHEIEAEGAFGTIEVRVRNRPSPDNPKSSAITGLSVVRAIRRLTQRLVIGV